VSVLVFLVQDEMRLQSGLLAIVQRQADFLLSVCAVNGQISNPMSGNSGAIQLNRNKVQQFGRIGFGFLQDFFSACVDGAENELFELFSMQI